MNPPNIMFSTENWNIFCGYLKYIHKNVSSLKKEINNLFCIHLVIFSICTSKTFFVFHPFLSAFPQLSVHEAAYRDTRIDEKLIFGDSYAQPAIERSISLHPRDNS